jgi:hypothetical protein
MKDFKQYLIEMFNPDALVPTNNIKRGNDVTPHGGTTYNDPNQRIYQARADTYQSDTEIIQNIMNMEPEERNRYLQKLSLPDIIDLMVKAKRLGLVKLPG